VRTIKLSRRTVSQSVHAAVLGLAVCVLLAGPAACLPPLAKPAAGDDSTNTPLAWRACTSLTDCLPGQRCSRVPIGGDADYCLTPDTRQNVPRYTCPVNYPENACCRNADCKARKGGVCVKAPTVPYCGGAMPPPWNACNYDACDNTTACGPYASCIPRGFYNFIVNTCVPGDGCTSDSACTAGAAGRCTFFAAVPYCPVLTNVGCTYSTSVCRQNADCAADQVCQWVAAGGQTACVDAPMPPPRPAA
jgi:hypothetical protein